MELTHLPAIFAKISQARGSAGWLREHWINAKMMKGGQFTLQRIHCEVPSKQTRQTVTYGSKGSDADHHANFHPTSDLAFLQ